MKDTSEKKNKSKLKLGTIFQLAGRNLLRHKMRTILLGIVIAFGVMILVVANSFTEGLKDVVLNKIIVNWMGHLNITVIERSGNKMNDKKKLIRDVDRITDIIQNALPNINFMREGLECYSFFVGNKASSVGMMIGLQATNADSDWMELLEGDINDFREKKYPYGVLVYEGMMKNLNLKLFDTIKVKVDTIYGKVQSAQLTVIGVMKSASTFQDMGIFVDMDTLKYLMEFKTNETGSIVIALKDITDPYQVLPWAQKLFDALQPGIAGMYGKASAKGKTVDATQLGVMTNQSNMTALISNVQPVSGNLMLLTNTNTAAVNAVLASQLGIKPGDTLSFKYDTKFDKKTLASSYKVVAVFESADMTNKPVVVIPHTTFYNEYCEFLPMEICALSNAFYPTTNSAVYTAFAKEWDILPRSLTSEEMMKKMDKVNKSHYKGIKMNVSSMYETAEMFINIANTLGLVGFSAVMILFFIILVGIGNTLRMTIRERTREIGTIRAIGMQQKDIRRLFTWETTMLALFASIIGAILGLVMIFLLGLITFKNPGDFSILMVNKHLNFLPTFQSIWNSIFTIAGLTFLVSYFPSRKAAKMEPTDALRGIMNKSDAK